MGQVRPEKIQSAVKVSDTVTYKSLAGSMHDIDHLKFRVIMKGKFIKVESLLLNYHYIGEIGDIFFKNFHSLIPGYQPLFAKNALGSFISMMSRIAACLSVAC